MNEALDAYWGEAKVGTLHNEWPLRFRYAPAWLAQPAATPISPSLPLQPTDLLGAPVEAFFENLLPEGRLRRLLTASRHTSTLFGLLASVAGDTAGALILLPSGEFLQPPSYQPTTWREIAKRLQPGTTLVPAGPQAGARLSLAGAQEKLLLMLGPEGQPAYPKGTAPSSHILKPDIRDFRGVWASALNETLTMQLAGTLGLGVAETHYQPDTQACLIRRYDRKLLSDGSLQRLHQLDLCQLAGKSSDVKYEADGGPGLAQCRTLLQESGVPAADLKRLTQWVIFNLCVGNHDSHAKNLSVLFQGGQCRLAPFYDLMCTALYPGLSRSFAFEIDGESAPGRIGRKHLENMAEALGFSPRYVLTLADELMQAIPAALGTVEAALVASTRTGTEHVLIERLGQYIRSNTRKCARRWQSA